MRMEKMANFFLFVCYVNLNILLHMLSALAMQNNTAKTTTTTMVLFAWLTVCNTIV